ncbi:MAG: DUF1993 family protein [Parvularculaceae bacterium]
MSLTFSAVAQSTIGQMFTALDGILAKAAEHAEADKIEESALLDARLYPDMFPMSRQVQIACDIAARGLSRLAGVEPPSFPDEEKTFEELRARIKKTKTVIDDLPAEAIDADPDKDITFPVGPETMTLKRQAFLLNFVLPNVYFHVTTTYDLLRHCGVALGKRDFLAVSP